MKPATVVALAGILAAGLVLASWTRMSEARRRAQVTAGQATAVASQLAELTVLEKRPALIARGKPVDQVLASKLGAACAAAGVPQWAITSVAPGSESTPGHEGLAYQDAAVTLDGITLAQLGRFLDAWRAAEPVWRFTGVQFAPRAAEVRDGATTPLRVQLALRLTFAEERTP